MKRLNILVDMDDVLVDLLPTWVEHLNQRFGTNVAVADIKDWNISQYFPSNTDDELYDVLQSQTFWQQVQPKREAVSTLQLLLGSGHLITVVTSSHYETVAHKMRECLLHHFPFIEWEDIIVASKKQMIQGDVLIDDGIHNLIGGAYTQLLMDMPHNQNIDAEKYGVIRVHDWAEVYSNIRKLSEDGEQRGDCGDQLLGQMMLTGF